MRREMSLSPGKYSLRKSSETFEHVGRTILLVNDVIHIDSRFLLRAGRISSTFPMISVDGH